MIKSIRLRWDWNKIVEVFPYSGTNIQSIKDNYGTWKTLIDILAKTWLNAYYFWLNSIHMIYNHFYYLVRIKSKKCLNVTLYDKVNINITLQNIKLCALVLPDLSSPLDTINHPCLLSRLWNRKQMDILFSEHTGSIHYVHIHCGR